MEDEDGRKRGGRGRVKLTQVATELHQKVT
jgi:hypothetical protein